MGNAYKGCLLPGPPRPSIRIGFVTASVTGGGTLNTSQVVGGTQTPSVSFTYTAPSSGAGKATVTLQVPGQGVANTVLTRTVTITH